MNIAKRLALHTAALGLLLLVSAPAVHAQNQLANPGFETGGVGYGAPGWTTFGNGFTEATSACIVPYEGNQLMKMFGGFTGGFSVSGTFQEFATAPGVLWTLAAKSRHCSDDPMLGVALPRGGNGNWVVQKLAFFDASNTEITSAAVESTILDGSFATNTWFNNAPISGVAPSNAVKVQAFILYLAPGNDGGAAQIDAVSLTKLAPTPARNTTWSKVKSLYR